MGLGRAGIDLGLVAGKCGALRRYIFRFGCDSPATCGVGIADLWAWLARGFGVVLSPYGSLFVFNSGCVASAGLQIAGLFACRNARIWGIGSAELWAISCRGVGIVRVQAGLGGALLSPATSL